MAYVTKDNICAILQKCRFVCTSKKPFIMFTCVIYSWLIFNVYVLYIHSVYKLNVPYTCGVRWIHYIFSNLINVYI